MDFIHKVIIILISFTFLTSCQLKKSTRAHGILFLENRLDQMEVNSSNINDALRIIGPPHTKSIDTTKDTWFYFETVKGKGKFHQLGKLILEENNVAVLEFDKFGILKNKNLYEKEDLKKMKFSDKNTENIMSQKSFVEKFLSSVRSKMYGK